MYDESMKLPIYMDYQATTPVEPRVLKAMQPYFGEEFGNAASRHHSFGWKAEAACEKAREQISRMIGARSKEEIVFTSGATESNNLALQGIARMYRERGNHIITSAIEHKSILETCHFLEGEGFSVTYLPVSQEGLIDLEQLKSAITKKTILISIMHANNEIGTIQSIREIGKLAKEKEIFFHCDAAQSIGKIPLDVEYMHIDLLSFSAHKVYGPKGIGALYVRKQNPRVRLLPMMYGGGHENSLRSGTLNVAGIVGFGCSIDLAEKEREEESERILFLREKLRTHIMNALHHVHINGSLEHRLPGNLNLSFDFVEGEALLTEICKEVAVSSGSACSQVMREPSYVIQALHSGVGLEHTSIRFGLGRFNTEEEVNFAADSVVKVVRRLRKDSPLYKSAVLSGGIKK